MVRDLQAQEENRYIKSYAFNLGKLGKLYSRPGRRPILFLEFRDIKFLQRETAENTWKVVWQLIKFRPRLCHTLQALLGLVQVHFNSLLLQLIYGMLSNV